MLLPCCCAALILACRCSGGWKYLHFSREQRPLTLSMQTVTVLSVVSTVICSSGCANLHSVSPREQLPRWNSLHTWGRGINGQDVSWFAFPFTIPSHSMEGDAWDASIQALPFISFLVHMYVLLVCTATIPLRIQTYQGPR